MNVYDWTTRKLIQKIDLGMEGVMPLEIRWVFCSTLLEKNNYLMIVKIFEKHCNTF